jgi:hypothetical protein
MGPEEADPGIARIGFHEVSFSAGDLLITRFV